jgi:crotonobetainyl-CoA:carnitine CoA-transferase CaiB-like acyl-CoA transferase
VTAARQYPLEGVRVLDLTQYIAGPYTTQVLADLGATVLKVERPGRGDVYRAQGPLFINGESVSFLALNRGKRSLLLDWSVEEGRETLRRLLSEVDVLVENMRPGTLARYGLDFDSVHADVPRLVYCSISAFGQTGPRANEGGYDLTIQAFSGLMSMTGHPGGPPAKIPVAALDFGSALYATVGILAALHQREATGKGQWVQTSILETSLAWLSLHIATFLAGGAEPGPAGSRSPFFAPYEAYRAEDGYVVVCGTGVLEIWPNLCAVLGVERLVDDPRYATNSARVQHADELRDELERVFVTRPAAHWERELTEARIACTAVQGLSDVLASPQVEALEMIQELEHPVAGPVPIVRLPITLSGAASTAATPPPRLGESTDAEPGRGRE